jgi:hypothetical protein
MTVPLRYITRQHTVVKALQCTVNNHDECAAFAGEDYKCPLDGYLVKFENGDVVAMPETAFLHLFEIA